MSTVDVDPPAASAWRTPELEVLTRRLLEILGRITGLESTYLTVIHWERDLQEILYARNVGGMEIPEGLQVPWADTLCRRALEGGPSYTADVARDIPRERRGEGAGPRHLCDGAGDRTRRRHLRDRVRCERQRCGVTDDAALVMDTLADMITLQLAADAAARMLAEQAHDLATANAALERLALTDGLTGTGNRRSLERDLSRLSSFALRHAQPLAAIVIDIDEFKTINDTHGHGAGDEVLRVLARHLRAQARNEDVIARLGGDEFVILCATDCAGATTVAERVRAAVAAGPVPTDEGPVRVTVSIGVASGDGSDPEGLLRTADASLYAAKGQGRNLVTAAGSSPCAAAGAERLLGAQRQVTVPRDPVFAPLNPNRAVARGVSARL